MSCLLNTLHYSLRFSRPAVSAASVSVGVKERPNPAYENYQSAISNMCTFSYICVGDVVSGGGGGGERSESPL